MNNNEVVVIIAHYNYQKFLKKSITSALNQTHKNTFVCVVDDGSDDIESVKNICEDCFGGCVDFFGNTYIYERGFLICLDQNVGPSEARNTAINAFRSTADFFMILDADDEMMDNKVSELLKPMILWDSVGVCYADYIIRNEEGLTRQENKTPYSLEKLKRECIVHSGSLIRAKALYDVENENGFFDRNFRVCEDYQLWLRIASRYMIYHVPKYLTIVNDHRNNSTNTVSKEEWQYHWSMLNSSIKG